MLNNRNSKNFEEIVRKHTSLLRKKREMLQQEELDSIPSIAKDAQYLIQEICEAACDIPDSNQRQILRSYVEYWKPLIYESENNYPEISLKPFRDEQKVQRVLNYFGQSGREAQKLLFLTLEKIATPNFNFNEIVKSFVWETLAYYWETFEEKEQLEKSIICIGLIAYLKSLYDVIGFVDKEAPSNFSNFWRNRYIYELIFQQITELEKRGWK